MAACSLGNNFEGQLPQTGNTFQICGQLQQAGRQPQFQVWRRHSLSDVRPASVLQRERARYALARAEPMIWAVLTTRPVGEQRWQSLPNFLLGLAEQLTAKDPRRMNWSAARRCTCMHRIAGSSRSNLTLNYGLRWEMNTPLNGHRKESADLPAGQMSTIYPARFAQTDPLYDPANGMTDCNSAGVTPVGLVFPGDKGVPNGLSEHVLQRRLRRAWASIGVRQRTTGAWKSSRADPTR